MGSSIHIANSLKDLGITARRPSKRPSQHESTGDDTLESPPPPAKKAKTTHIRQLPHAEVSPSSLRTDAVAPVKETKISESVSNQTAIEIPREVQHLATKYDFTSMSIISSSKIERKTRNVLERVSKFSFTDVKGKPGVVILHAYAKNANKLVTIAEVSKREIEREKGKWWQYTKLEGQLSEMKIGSAQSELEPGEKTLARWEAQQAKGSSKGTTADVQAGESFGEMRTDAPVDNSGGASALQNMEEGEEEEEEVFETMTVPATDPKMTDGGRNVRKKARASPVITIFLAKVPIPGLKELYG